MTDYTYADQDGDTLRLMAATASKKVVASIGSSAGRTVYIDNTDAPTVAAEILKAAGQDGVFIPRAYEEVERLGDELACGSGPEWAGATIHANPNWLRNRAANCIAIAEYIEGKAQREAEAKKQMQERRAVLMRAFGYHHDWERAKPMFRNAIDRIIELEDGQAK